MKRRAFVYGMGAAVASLLALPLVAASPKEATCTLEVTGMT